MYVALTSDGWTSRATESFLIVTAHYITSEWEMKSSVLQTQPLYESHTSKHLSEALTEAVTVRDTFVKDNSLCQINEKHVGTSYVPALAVPEFYLLLT